MRARGIVAGLVAGLAAGSLLLAGCTPNDQPSATPTGGSTGSSTRPAAGSSTPSPTSTSSSGQLRADDPALDEAVSTPVEDRVYPEVGDPGVDALHYGLDLTWTPRTRTLDGVETLVFRATADADSFRLDLEQPLTVTGLTLDGQDVDHEHPGKDLVVKAAVTEDRRYTLEIHYSGKPRPVAAPTTRSDFSTLGWTTTRDGQTWTMQEPYGAYSWYAVNDQPSDKALYDFTISVPSPWVGVANGRLASRTVSGGDTVTRWHLDEPAASYLVTVAIGDFRQTRDRSSRGIPISYWTPRGDRAVVRGLRRTPAALDWIEGYLGPYPFSSLGILIVESRSGMETQTMITLGNGDYTTSPEVLVHEMVHQWYGDEVTPTDWRDVWMSEGMALYLQGMWEARFYHVGEDALMDQWAAAEPAMRREAGPPADYDPSTFGEGNIYYGPAVMWHELRKRLGDDRFWALVRAWPKAHENGNASYDDITSWWSDRTGLDLSSFFDAWLLGKQSPPRKVR